VGEFGLEVRLFRAAHAGAARIEVLAAGLAVLHVAGLRHEILDDAVEDDAVIGAFTRQFLDACDVARSQIRQKLDDHPALGGFHDDRVFRILDLGHDGSPSRWGYSPAVTLIIRSGSATAPFDASSPRLILSTFSMPSTTLPTTVYWPFRKSPGANMMKN